MTSRRVLPILDAFHADATNARSAVRALVSVSFATEVKKATFSLTELAAATFRMRDATSSCFRHVMGSGFNAAEDDNQGASVNPMAETRDSHCQDSG